MNASKDLIQAIAVTAELCQTNLSEMAARVLCEDLAGYPEQQVLGALVKCRRELQPGKFCLQAVLSRLDDGRPGVEEAWALCQMAGYGGTVVWTSEMQDTWVAVASNLFQSGDHTAARMAFKELYAKMVADARECHLPVQWKVRIGRADGQRDQALADAVEAGRISAEDAQPLMTCPGHAQEKIMRLVEENERRALIGGANAAKRLEGA